MDTLGKECIESGECLFKYKECVDIPPLAMIDDILAVSDCSVESLKMNALIQSKVAHKNLQLGPDKCFKMYVGQQSDSCPTLKFGDEEMLSSHKEKYLGDILTTDGKIDYNIEERYNKGIGIVNTILSMLNEISFGQYYFEMAVMFRQSMLLNGILCNSEVLYGVNKNHIEILESVDKYFWRKVFQCPISTPTEIFYMETNTTPIKFVLMSRRLMYYWNILQMDDSELVKRVYNVQKISSCRNDWVRQISADLLLCKMNKSEDEIKMMKKYPFKKLVKQKIREASLEYLLALKNDPKRSKSKNIWPSEDMKLYLKTNLISTKEKILLFSMRSRTNDLKWNYKEKYKNNLNCSLCRKCFKESESHLLQCEELTSEPEISNEIKKIEYMDIYGTLKDQIQAVKVWKGIFKIRTLKLEKRKLSYGHQVHQLSASCSYSSPQVVDSSSLDSASSTNCAVIVST